MGLTRGAFSRREVLLDVGGDSFRVQAGRSAEPRLALELVRHQPLNRFVPGRRVFQDSVTQSLELRARPALQGITRVSTLFRGPPSRRALRGPGSGPPRRR